MVCLTCNITFNRIFLINPWVTTELRVHVVLIILRAEARFETQVEPSLVNHYSYRLMDPRETTAQDDAAGRTFGI